MSRRLKINVSSAAITRLGCDVSFRGSFCYIVRVVSIDEEIRIIRTQAPKSGELGK